MTNRCMVREMCGIQLDDDVGLSIKVQCWRYSDCCFFEVNLATLTCHGCYHILHIGFSLTSRAILFDELVYLILCSDCFCL